MSCVTYHLYILRNILYYSNLNKVAHSHA